MAVTCGKCGARLASKAALPGHFRRAHSKGRKVRRLALDNPKFPSLALVPVKARPPRPGAIRAEVLDVTPTRSQIVPVARVNRAPAHLGEIVPVSRPVSPKRRSSLSPDGKFWWEREKIKRSFVLETAAPQMKQAGAAFTIRPPQATNDVILRSQFHALKALAVRLDAGIGSERERAAFEAGLREYNKNFDRIARTVIAHGA